MNTEQYEALPARRQLSIVCAGVWHNFVVAVIAYLMLMSLPTLLLPFYDADSGVVVQSIDQVCIFTASNNFLHFTKYCEYE